LSETIRYLVLSNIISRLSEITTDHGFQTDVGANVRVSPLRVSGDSHPSIVVLPQEEAREDYRYGLVLSSLSLVIESTLPLPIEGDPALLSERMRGDIVTALTSDLLEVHFSGGVLEVSPGALIEGGTSGATAVVEHVFLNTGSWAGEDAAGIFNCRQKIGDFDSSEQILFGIQEVADVVSTYGTSVLETIGSGLTIDSIQFTSGGVIEFPGNSDSLVSTQLNFEIRFPEAIGNPYSQTR
jgi:hypothetical protein